MDGIVLQASYDNEDMQRMLNTRIELPIGFINC